MSRKGQRESARTARLEAVRREQRHREHRRRGLIVAASVAVVAVVALVGGGSWAVIGASGSGSSTQDTVALTGLQTYTGLALSLIHI